MTERLDILNSPIPLDGRGRKLTSAELRSLRKHGYSCSTGWRVVRTGGDADHVGAAYKPSSGGLANMGVILTWEAS